MQNPYLQALQPNPNLNLNNEPIQSGEVNPYQLALQQQANMNSVYQDYVAPATQASARVENTNLGLGVTLGSRLAQQTQVYNNPVQATADERSRSRMQEAKQYLAARLGDKEAKEAVLADETKIALGEDPRQVKADRENYNQFKKQVSAKNRINNFEAFKISPSLAQEDLDLMRDILFTSPENVKAKYHDQPELLEYILNQKEERKDSALKATSLDPQDASILNPRNLAGAFVSGIGETVGGITDAYNMATLEGQERVDALNNSLTQSFSDVGDSLQSVGAKASDTRAEGQTYYENLAGQQAYLQARDQNKTKNVAEAKAEVAKTAESFTNLIDNLYQIKKKVAQFIPDVLASLVTGGMVTAGANAMGKSALKKVENKFEKELAQGIKEASIKESLEKGLSQEVAEANAKNAVAQAKNEFMKEANKQISERVNKISRAGIAGTESVLNATQNAPQGYQTASQNIMNLPLDTLKKTKGFQDYKIEHPELSDKEIQAKMADGAGQRGYAYAGALSAITGAVGSKVESDILLGFNKGIKKTVKNTGINAVEEAVEEGGSVVAGNIATNQKTKEDTVNSFKDAGKAAVLGAIAGGTTTAAVSVPAHLKSTTEKVLGKGLNIVANKQEKKLQEKSNQAVKDALGSEEDGTTSITNKKFSETNFGKAYNKLASDLENSAFKDVFADKANYTASIQKLNQIKLNGLKEIESLKEQGKTEEVKSIQQQVNAIDHELSQLTNALNEDLKENIHGYKDYLQKIHDANISGKPTEEINAIWDEFDKAMAKNDKFKALKESTLYKILDQETRNTITSDVQITASDILGSGKFSLSPAKAFKQAVDKNKEIIDKFGAAKPEDKDSLMIDIAGNIANFSASLANRMPQTIQEANAVRGQVRTLLGQLNKLATVSKSDDLKNIVKTFTDVVNKPIPSGTNLKAYTETMFGGTNAGLLDYLTRALANRGVMDADSATELFMFLASQEGKILGVKNAIEELKQGKQSVEVINYALRNKGDFRTYTQSGESAVTLTNLNQANEYLRKVTADSAYFSDLAQTILGMDLTKPSTKPNTEKTKKDSVEQPEVKPEFTSADESYPDLDEVNPPAVEKSQPVKEQSKEQPKKQSKEQVKETESKTNKTIDINWGKKRNKQLSNLAPRPFKYKDRHGDTVREYRSVEHFYQTWKSGYFDKNAYRSTAIKPKGNRAVNPAISETVMKEGLLASFKANPKVLQNLLATQDKTLTHEVKDKHWAEAFPRLLMEVRDELKDYKPETKPETESKPEEEVKGTNQQEYTLSDSSMTLSERLALSQPIIADQVAESFESSKKDWKTKFGNELTEFDTKETDTIIQIQTDKGLEDFHIPMSAMVEMNRKGYDPTVNLLEATTSKKELHTKEQAEAFMDNPSSLLGEHPLNEAFEFIVNNTKQYFSNLPSIFDDSYKSKLGKFHLINGMLNLVSIENTDGKIKTVVPAEVQMAFAKAQAIAMANYRDTSFSKDSQYSDYWFEDLKAKSVNIKETTKSEILGSQHRDGKPKEVALEHYSQLGITRNDFIENLGKEVIKQLGLQFNAQSPEYSEDIRNGLIYSLGIELYNSMLNQGLLTSHTVDLTLDLKGNEIKSIPYVNFNLNLEDNNSDISEAVNVITSGVPNTDLTEKEALKALNKQPANKVVALLSKYITSDKAKTIFGEEVSTNTGVHIGSLSKRVGKSAKVDTRKVRSSDIKNDITTPNNPELKSAIAHMNNVSYALNLPLFNLLKTNPEALQLAFGFEPNVDENLVSDATLKAIKSKNNSITRAIGLLNKFVLEAKDKGLSEDDVMFQFNHHFVPNMRTMLNADMNPQSNKIIREMLRLVHSDVNQEDGTITGEMNLSIDLGAGSKFYNKGKPRTVESLIETATGKRKSKARNFAIGFLLALNQGLDIGKIEKTKTEKAFTDVAEVLNNPEHFLYQMTDLVWAMQQAQEQDQTYLLTQGDKDLLQTFGKELGNAAPRALNAIQSWANYKYRGTTEDKLAKAKDRKLFSTSLLLEADGIGNGLHNITRQFAIKFSPEYLNTLKRTGIVTLDVLSQLTVEKLNKQQQDKLVSSFEGSAGMFMPTQNQRGQDTTLMDIYEVIATDLSLKANAALDRIKKYQGKSLTEVTFKEFFALTSKKNKELPDDIREDISFLMQLHMTGMATNNIDTPLNNLVYAAYNNIALPEDFLIDIKRNLAKAGVTPTVYGGQLQGIASQLYTDTKKKLIAKGDKLIELAHKIDNTTDKQEKEQLSQELNDLYLDFADSFKYLGIKFDNIYLPEVDTSKEASLIKHVIDKNLFKLNSQRQQFIYALKNGLASKIRDGVQSAYVESFSMLNFAMAQDDMAFANFTEEFTDKVQQAIKARNQAKGYKPNDPRNHSPLSRSEIRDVIKTITSAPVIATAFNADSVLFEDVFELGNSLVKRGSTTLDEQSTINTIYANKQGNWYHNLTTQLLRDYRKYASAGAANATYTIPSTESKTQATLAERLIDLFSGVVSLNVFDGIDGLLYFRDLLGSLANEQTNKVHLETSILNAFYDKFVKSGLGEVIQNTNKLRALEDVVNSKPTGFSDFLQKATKHSLYKEDIKYLLGVATLMQMQIEGYKASQGNRKLSFDERDMFQIQSKNLTKLKSVLMEKFDLLNSGKEETVTLVLNPKTDYPNFKFDFSILGEPDTVIDTIDDQFKGLYNTIVKFFVHQTASNRAIKKVEEKYLPAIINQFAGGNRGFLFNANQLNKTGKRFMDFVIKQKGANYFVNFNFLTDSDLLSQFLNTDPEIVEAYKEEYSKVKSKLQKPYITSGTKNLELKPEDKIYTLDKILKGLHKQTSIDNPLVRTNKVIGNLLKDYPVVFGLTKDTAESLLPKGKIIHGFKTREESIDYLIKDVNSASLVSGSSFNYTLLDEQPNTESKVNQLGFIYINPNTNLTGGDLLQLITHEGIHSVVNSLVNYSINPEIQEQLSKDNPELAEKLDNFTGRLQANIDKFIEKNQNLDEIQNNLETLRNDASTRHHYIGITDGQKQKQARKIANIANYIYFFKELDENNLPDGFTPDMLLNARRGTLHELLAYSLSDYDTLNELSSHKEASWFNKLTDGLKELYKSIRTSIRNLFGINEDTTPEDVSMVDAMLESIAGFYLNQTEDLSSELQLYESQDRQSGAEYNQLFNNYSNQETNSGKASISNVSSFPLNPINNKFREVAKKSIDTIMTKHSKVLTEYPDQTMVLLNKDDNRKLSKVLRTLRNRGYVINTDEENDIKLAYKLNLIGQEVNTKLNKHISDSLQDYLDNIPDNIIKVINDSGLDKGALSLAVLSLSKSVNESVAIPATKNRTKTQSTFKRLNDKIEDIFDFTGLTDSEKTLPVLPRLQLAIADFNQANVSSMSTKELIFESEMDKLKANKKYQEFLSDLSDKLPKPLSVMLDASQVLLSGKDYHPSGADQDSSVGQLIRLVLRNEEELKGRNTLLTKILALFVGQDSKTQYSAKLKGEASQLNAIIRERVAKIIPESIIEQFGSLSDKDNKALDNVLLQSQLNRLRLDITNFADVLESQSSRDLEIAQTEADISQALEDLEYNDKETTHILNFIRWQTQGLGEWVVKNEAKYKTDYESNILPNAKAISSLISIKRVANKASSEAHTKALRRNVEKLVSLHSLAHHDQKDLDTLAKLYRNKTKAFKDLLLTLDVVDSELEIYGEDSYAGFDGFIMNKRNPYKDIKILNNKLRNFEKEQDKLKSLGYELVQTLPNGDEVWFTNENPTNRFTTGVFNMTEHTVRGMDTKTFKPLHSYDSDIERKSLDLSLHPALKDYNYYNKLSAYSSKRTLVDNTGKIIGYSSAIPKSLENSLIETYENGLNAIGNLKGRIIEEITTEANNKIYADQLIAVYQEKKRLGQGNRFMKIDGNVKPKSNSNADIEFANRVNSIYNSLPASTRKHIETKGGLYIERTEIDNLLGYNQASWSDVFTGKSGLPEPVQQMIRATISTLVKLYGGNPVKFMKRTERILNEVSSLSKDFILNRSGIVALGNMVSNLIHLWNTGVPLRQIPVLMREGFLNVRKYNQDYNRTLELRHLISISTNGKEKAKLQLELDVLEKALTVNPVLPLVSEGILTNISSASGVDENNPYGLINTAQRKLGFTKFKQTKVGKVWGNVMVQEGSSTHTFMNGALDYGDFVAKYALYQHLVKNRGFDSERALNVIRDEFVNYGINRGRAFDWSNKVGLTWFLSYKLGIQKIFFRNLRRNFFRTAAVYSGAKVLNTNQVVPAQNLLFDGSLRYQTDPTNLWNGFKTHWIGQVFG